MTELRAAGIALDVPAGWEADIRAPLASLDARGGYEPTVVHVANFRLPADRAEYGGEILAGLGPADVFVSIIEFGPVTDEQRLFDHVGMPLPLLPADFSPEAIVRGLPGKSAAQRFFRVGNRGFCLYVVAGSHLDRSDVLETVNDVLATIEIDPGG